MRINTRQCVFIILLTIVVVTLIFLQRRDDDVPYNNTEVHLAEDFIQIPRNNCVDTFREKIPKIIHQKWKSEVVPTEFVESVKSLVRDNPHPEWQYFWWTTETMIKLVHDKHPHLLSIMNSTATPEVMRSDIMRYVVLYEFGGVYFDLDTISVRPLNSFVDTHECVLALEPGEHYFLHNTNFFLTNSALMCEPRHPFFRHMIETLRRDPLCKKMFFCAGSPILTREYLDIKEKVCDSCKIPEVVSSEVFQDKYDANVHDIFLEANCFNYKQSRNYQIEICENWKLRGRQNRTLSAKAYTYHTWYHMKKTKVTSLDKNHISNVIPTARIYGRHFLSTSSNKTYHLI